MEYPQSFKEAMVRKMTAPGRKPTVDLAAEMGLHPSTLSRWVREAGRVGDMSQKKIKKTGRRPDDRTPEEKFQLLLEASLLADEELGAFLREKGLHEAQLEQWQRDALSGLVQKKTTPQQSKEIRELKIEVQKRDKEILRKDKALAEAAALIVLKKKADALWGVEDDDTE
jgi:transposase-like protein